MDPITGLPVAGTVTNAGLIESPRADVTMVGQNVDQLGVIDSTTSVALNGRIDLTASYGALFNSKSVSNSGVSEFYSRYTGSVELGEGSVTRILPEWDSLDQVTGDTLTLPSIVDVLGETIHLAANAAIEAPDASLPTSITAVDASQTSLTAGVSLDAGTWTPHLGATVPVGFTTSVGQVYIDTGATIDVAGSENISAPVTENIVTVQLLGPELADSPLQRTGLLRGQKINIDVTEHGPWVQSLNGGLGGYQWIGTPLADTTGYVNLIEHTVGELDDDGGSVNIAAGGSVVLKPGSLVNVSGGSIDYQGAIVDTSQVSSGGQIYDISAATPGRVYDGLYTGSYTVTSTKWGVIETFVNPLYNSGHYEAGYVQGGNGGNVSIIAPAVALDGNLIGNTVAGSNQRNAAPSTESAATLESVTGVNQRNWLPAGSKSRFHSSNNWRLLTRFYTLLQRLQTFLSRIIPARRRFLPFRLMRPVRLRRFRLHVRKGCFCRLTLWEPTVLDR